MILRRWISDTAAVGEAGGSALVGVAPTVGNLEAAAPAAEGAAAAKAKAAADGAPPKAKRKPNRELESLRSKATEKKKRRKPNNQKEKPGIVRIVGSVCMCSWLKTQSMSMMGIANIAVPTCTLKLQLFDFQLFEITAHCVQGCHYCSNYCQVTTVITVLL